MCLVIDVVVKYSNDRNDVPPRLFALSFGAELRELRGLGDLGGSACLRQSL